MSKAVVLLSGGLDSSTCLGLAKRDGYETYALSFDYGQRNKIELRQAGKIAQALGAAAYKIFKLDLSQFGGSALTDSDSDVPDFEESRDNIIPVTYVPNRNTIFISIGLAWAETLGAERVYIGANAIDYSNYPDCRPGYFVAWKQLAGLASKAAVEGTPIEITTPLLMLKKSEIIKQGMACSVDYGLTVSCYQPTEDGKACGHCDACTFRRQGFEAAGVPDPTRYV